MHFSSRSTEASAHHPNESQKWVSNRIKSWVETYEKSMLTPVILTVVTSHQPASVVDVADRISATTG